MGDELSPVASDLLAIMEKLASEIPMLPNADEATRRFEWLLDALILRGQLPPRFRQLSKKIQADRGIKIRLNSIDDKYRVENSDVDCAARIPLCGARCCSFEVALSRQDVEEAKLPFEIDQPYLLRRDPTTRRCVCSQPDGGCGAYEHRPGPCREYDCKQDRRIWIDYEARIPAPLPEGIRNCEVFENPDD